MSYTVELIYSKNEDYTNPQTLTETGQPTSIQLTNLESDQAYYIKAVLKNDGVVEDEDTSKFTTLSPVVDKTEYFHITNTSDTVGKFYITRVYEPETADLKYSFDGVDWVTADLSTDFYLEVAAGTNVYMKGTNTYGFNRGVSSYYKMSMDVEHSIGGNIMSIVDEENYATITSMPVNNGWCFTHLFDGDTHLVNAGGVNFGSVTSIGKYGCSYMYYGCKALTTPTDLSNVTSIDELGCQSMYSGCTSLTTPADLSNITSISNYGCSGMYYNCKALTTGSDLSKVTSVGYESCSVMYNSCSSMVKVIAPNISTWDTDNANRTFDNWLYGVAPTGVVHKPANLTIPTNSTSGVPTGWTTQNY